MYSDVKSVGDYRITLEFRETLHLKNSFYIPSFQQNLISMIKLVKNNYGVNFDTSDMSLTRWNITIEIDIIY